MSDADPTLQAEELAESRRQPPVVSSSAAPHHADRAPYELWKDSNAGDRELERMHHGTPIQCLFCVGQKFRRSRLRSADIRQLLLMRYPVRCTRCAQRQTVSFTVAGVSMPSHLRHRDGRPSNFRRPSAGSSAPPAAPSRNASPSDPAPRP